MLVAYWPAVRARIALFVAVVVIVLAYRARFGFSVAAVLLPQREDAQALAGIARAATTRLRGG